MNERKVHYERLKEFTKLPISLFGLDDILEMFQQIHVQFLLVQSTEIGHLLNKVRIDAPLVQHVHEVVVEAL
jgi:hypothetical protein